MSDDLHKLHREIDAARRLREQMANLLADDPEFTPELMEAETNINEAIQAAVTLYCQDQTSCAAIDEHIKLMQARKHRLTKRMTTVRAMVAIALDAAGKKTIETALGTATVKTVPPGLMLDKDDEANIPLEYWKAGDPKLDKKKLLADLKAGKKVEGARLDNGDTTVAFSFR